MTLLELVAEPGIDTDASPGVTDAGPPTLVVDLSGIDHLDPTTIRALLRLSLRVRDLGGSLEITDPAGALERTQSILVREDTRTALAQDGTCSRFEAPAEED